MLISTSCRPLWKGIQHIQPIHLRHTAHNGGTSPQQCRPKMWRSRVAALPVFSRGCFFVFVSNGLPYGLHNPRESAVLRLDMSHPACRVVILVLVLAACPSCVHEVCPPKAPHPIPFRLFGSQKRRHLWGPDVLLWWPRLACKYAATCHECQNQWLLPGQAT